MNDDDSHVLCEDGAVALVSPHLDPFQSSIGEENTTASSADLESSRLGGDTTSILVRLLLVVGFRIESATYRLIARGCIFYKTRYELPIIHEY